MYGGKDSFPPNVSPNKKKARGFSPKGLKPIGAQAQIWARHPSALRPKASNPLLGDKPADKRSTFPEPASNPIFLKPQNLCRIINTQRLSSISFFQRMFYVPDQRSADHADKQAEIESF